jgi:hypothetical protein
MRRTATVLAISAVFIVPCVAFADNVLELRSSFIEKYKNRLTITCDYTVDAAHKHPNPGSKDGDMHIAGRCSEVGLHMVAEIQNAKTAPEAMAEVHRVEGAETTIPVTGVWRIWPEHAGNFDHIQQVGAGPEWTDPPPTNPPHVFEIHPVTQLAGHDLLPTLKAIPGFDPHAADEAFQRYESASFEMAVAPKSHVRMHMQMVGYNYVTFVMELVARDRVAPDGEFVYAAIRSTDGDVLAHKKRIGFVKDSEPYRTEQSMTVGQCVTLLGIPRLDLALVSWRAGHAKSNPAALKWSFPYEMVAVAVSGAPTDCATTYDNQDTPP